MTKSPSPGTGSRRITDTATIVVFAVILFLPLADSLLDLDPTPLISENRELASRPELCLDLESLVAFPDSFEAYVNDHVGFRRFLVRARGLALVQLLGVSPNKDVILGRDGWMFYTGQGKLDYFRSVELFSEKQLEHFQRAAERNRDRLRELGIEYALVIAPNKDSVYPEMMPARIGKVHEISRMDQVVEHMSRHSDVALIDPRPALREAKQRYRLYDKQDTHWNDLGALIAYQQIIGRLAERFPEIGRPMPVEAFEILQRQRSGFDLLLMLGLQGSLSGEVTLLEPREPSRASAAEVGAPLANETLTKLTEAQRPIAFEIDDPRLPSVTVFHDSFGQALKPLLAEHFRRTAFFHLYYYAEPWAAYETSSEVLAREQPDLVIQEVVERGLQNGPGVLSLVAPRRELAPTLVRSGRALTDRGRHQEALEPLLEATRLDPSAAQAWATLGLTYRRLGQTRNAQAALETTIKLAPGHFHGHHLLALTLADQGQWRKACDLAGIAQTLASTDRQRAESLAVAAHAHHALGDTARACAEIEQALALARPPSVKTVAKALGCTAGR